MASRATSTVVPAIMPTDLSACTDVAAVFALFRRLRYSVAARLEDLVEVLECEVDAIVYRTYGLTAEEIAEIERWHAERRALLGKGRTRGNGHSEEDAE